MKALDTPAARRIRIAFLIDTIDYQFGGTETQLVMLLRRLDRTRFDPMLCCLQDSPWLRAHRDLCPIQIVNFRSFYSLRDHLRFWQFVRFLRQQRFDILQSHFRDSNIVATLAGRLAGVRAIVATRRNQGYWHNRFELILLRLLNPLVTHFLVNAQAIRRYVESIEGVSPEKIEIIYNGLDLDGFGPGGGRSRDDVRAALGIAREATTVVLIGNLRPVKGIDVYLHALRRVLDRYPETCFLIVGDGPERESLTALAQSLGIASAVRFLGKRTDVAALLAASDIGALSSHSEGLSNAVIECMASGLPVVCTDVGGNRELVENGVCGYLVASGDSAALADGLLRLLDRPSDIKVMGARARARALELFDVRHCVANTEAFYQRVAGKIPVPGGVV